MTPDIVIQIVVAGLMGLLIGLVYFAALRRAVRYYVGGAAVAPALALTAFRVTFAIIAFWLIAHWSAVALVSAAAGFAGSRFLFQAPGEDV
jgi:hypothetical protein